MWEWEHWIHSVKRLQRPQPEQRQHRPPTPQQAWEPHASDLWKICSRGYLAFTSTMRYKQPRRVPIQNAPSAIESDTGSRRRSSASERRGYELEQVLPWVLQLLAPHTGSENYSNGSAERDRQWKITPVRIKLLIMSTSSLFIWFSSHLWHWLGYPATFGWFLRALSQTMVVQETDVL